jgi:hypothetical protein
MNRSTGSLIGSPSSSTKGFSLILIPSQQRANKVSSYRKPRKAGPNPYRQVKRRHEMFRFALNRFIS